MTFYFFSISLSLHFHSFSASRHVCVCVCAVYQSLCIILSPPPFSFFVATLQPLLCFYFHIHLHILTSIPPP